jgi:hypothetical protein
VVWTGLVWLRIEESSCERGNEISGPIKCWETTEGLHNLWPLERYSVPQSHVVIVRSNFSLMDGSFRDL